MWAGPDQDAIWDRAAKLGASFISHGPSVHYPDIEPIQRDTPTCPSPSTTTAVRPGSKTLQYPGMKPVLDLAKYPNVYVKLIPHKGTGALPL